MKSQLGVIATRLRTLARQPLIVVGRPETSKPETTSESDYEPVWLYIALAMVQICYQS